MRRTGSETHNAAEQRGIAARQYARFFLPAREKNTEEKQKKKQKKKTRKPETRNRFASKKRIGTRGGRGVVRFGARLGFFVGHEVGGRAVPDGRTKRAETETAAMRVVVDVSSNRYGSLASCCFPLAAVIPPRVAAGRAFFPDTLRWEFPPSRRLGSASLFTELRLMKTVCLARRASPIAACGRITSESISLAVISGTRSRWARVRSYEEHIPPGHHEAHFSGTDFFAAPTPGIISSLSRRAFSRT